MTVDVHVGMTRAMFDSLTEEEAKQMLKKFLVDHIVSKLLQSDYMQVKAKLDETGYEYKTSFNIYNEEDSKKFMQWMKRK